MQIPIVSLPRRIPVLPDRKPQENIPQTRFERERLKHLVAGFVDANSARLVPPLVLDELRIAAEDVVRLAGVDPLYTDYVAVLLNNEVWREQLATVPYGRRLLLLPKCLRVEDKCPAPFDEFGLLCKQCGLCTIQDLQEEAEKLGYAVLVAEGSALVMALIQTGKIDAIVGVSCLSVLERAFPYMEAAAIPGIAIPLLQDDCKDTGVDIEWVWDVIHITSEDKTRRLDLDTLRTEVQSWFVPASIEALLGPADGESDRIARAWLARAGKRWRPFLTVCAWKALQDDLDAPVPESLKKLALAVECFHKASLVHDDIEDGDLERYGENALHVEHGVPVALNCGDLLVGEGYRLIAESGAPAAVQSRLLAIASRGHRTLCLGQGAELCWMRDPRPVSSLDLLQIFRQKTAPAFEVALQMGAALAGGGEDLLRILASYSEALGIAYQIRDDIEDIDGSGGRPSLPLAVAFERAKGENKAALERVWRRRQAASPVLIAEFAGQRCNELMESYKEAAVRSLAGLDNASLKGLLRRVVGKIFQVEIKGWCSEFEARNAASRPAVAEAVG
ncbi:MAG: polyprenyl synthetase family protein [Acidobacteria bacterium]|nr:polyprenyl synthetase family protein [Acidobacteriota bacterium]